MACLRCVKMNRRLKLYLTALKRYKRSKGFGIHSPFAFMFVLRVLREPLAYYAYSDIDTRRAMAASLANKVEGRRPKLISRRSAKMLFRIACYFHPSQLLQVGTSYGVSTIALLDVSDSSRMMIYKGREAHDVVYDEITRRYSGRIISFATLAGATAAYRKACGDMSLSPFIMVNALDDTDAFTECADVIAWALQSEGVVVVRNLMRSPLVGKLFSQVDSSMDHGMTFTNGRMAVIVGFRHLPRQRFNLWF